MQTKKYFHIKKKIPDRNEFMILDSFSENENGIEKNSMNRTTGASPETLTANS